MSLPYLPGKKPTTSRRARLDVQRLEERITPAYYEILGPMPSHDASFGFDDALEVPFYSYSAGIGGAFGDGTNTPMTATFSLSGGAVEVAIRPDEDDPSELGRLVLVTVTGQMSYSGATTGLQDEWVGQASAQISVGGKRVAAISGATREGKSDYGSLTIPVEVGKSFMLSLSGSGSVQVENNTGVFTTLSFQLATSISVGAFARPELASTGLSFPPGDQEIAYDYEVRYIAPTADIPVKLYWAAGPEPSNAIPGLPPALTRTLTGAQIAVGSHPMTVLRTDLTPRPAGATHLVAILDPANVIGEDESTRGDNSVAAALPATTDIAKVSLRPHDDGSGSNPRFFGVDLVYTNSAGVIGDPQVEFLWANSPNPFAPGGQAVPAGQGQLPLWLPLARTAGEHLITLSPEALDPPSPGMRWLVAVLDNLNAVSEEDETNNVIAFEVPLPDLIARSLVLEPRPGAVKFTYAVEDAIGMPVPGVAQGRLYWADANGPLGSPIVVFDVDTAPGRHEYTLSAQELAQRGNRPPGATRLMAVLDPSGEGSPGESLEERDEHNNSAAAAIPDLAADKIAFKTTESAQTVVVDYTVSGVIQTAGSTSALSASLVWTDDEGTELGQPDLLLPVDFQPGSHQFIFAASQLGDAPEGATKLKVVFDPDEEIDEADEENNTASMDVLDLSIDPGSPTAGSKDVRWNTDRGPNITRPGRGFDFRYTGQAQVPADLPQVAFYWATGPTPQDRLLNGAAIEVWTSAQAAGGGFKNVPARWGTPPWDEAAGRPLYIQVVLDPQNLIAEPDEANNVVTIQVHSAAEILGGANGINAITVQANGPEILGSFVPGRAMGGLTLSEAEVALGVDHFNWVQTIAPPSNIRFEVWPVGTVFVADPYSHPVSGEPVDLPTTVYDPLPDGTGNLIYVLRADGNQLGDVQYIPIYAPTLPSDPTDAAEPYLQETPPDAVILHTYPGGGIFGGPVSPIEHIVFDSPSLPQDLFLFMNSYLTFRTQLVGVDYVGQTWHAFSQPKTGYLWKFNSYHGSDLRGYLNGRPADAPPILGGGVFGATYDDGTPVSGISTDPPPLAPPTAPPATVPPTTSVPPTTTSPPPTVTPQVMVSGGANGTVRVVSPSSGQSSTLQPFGSIAATVRTASADVDGDGTADTVAVTGPGVPIRVTVLSGKDGSVLVQQFDPFGGDFTGGGYVAAADLDRDGRAEFAVTPDEGGGPRVTIFTMNPDGTHSTRANFFGIDDANFRGGARVAFGDVNGDGMPDVVVAAGFGGGPRTAIFTGQSVLAGNPTRLVADFFAFPGSDAVNLRNGSFVAAGDITGDGFADLVFGGGPGGAPRVFVLSGALVSAGDVDGAQTTPVANFFVGGDGNDRGGARVAVKNSDGEGKADLVVGSGAGRPAKVRVYLGKDFGGNGEPAATDLDPFGGAVLADGVYVG